MTDSLAVLQQGSPSPRLHLLLTFLSRTGTSPTGLFQFLQCSELFCPAARLCTTCSFVWQVLLEDQHALASSFDKQFWDKFPWPPILQPQFNCSPNLCSPDTPQSRDTGPKGSVSIIIALTTDYWGFSSALCRAEQTFHFVDFCFLNCVTSM